ncbi:MAG: glucan biosynthesis protein D [Alphaproteobacteria bacterium]
MLNRRRFLETAALAGAMTGLATRTALAERAKVDLAEPVPFSFDGLVAEAKALAAAPYKEPEIRHADVLETIDYDAFQQIVFKRELGLGEGTNVNFPVQLFHLGRFFKAPVKIHWLEQGSAREVIYHPDYFTFGDTGLDQKLPDDLGFAGFRLQDGQDASTDWLALLGGAYFRSSGELNQYGLSARAIAIDTALSTPEEFPRFTAFWLQPGTVNSDQFTIYALMDGPSITGALGMVCTRAGKVQQDINARFFARKDIERMGIAPLTSMFWFGEHNRHQARDWRPEIHDSDGLAMWTGAGERLWRPLNNPPSVMTNSFIDENPRGFGLLQRDRAFHNYEDDGVFYDRRASVWIEPLGDWGKGAVQLVEIPTDDEIHDNIVMYWLPDQPVKAGSEWTFDYRLFWNADEPYPSTSVAHVIATRLGNGGIPGQPRPEGVKKFVIDFEGGPLKGVDKWDEVKPIISATRGEISNDYALQVVGTKNWRAFFDLKVEGNDPVNLRLYLQLGDKTLTETWLYQYHPFPYT